MSATPATLRRAVAWMLVHWPVTTPISASTLATARPALRRSATKSATGRSPVTVMIQAGW